MILCNYLLITFYAFITRAQSPEGEGNETQKAKARGFLHIMKDGALIKFSCFLHDLLTQLSSLSLTMQRSSVTVAEVHDSLSSTQAIMLKYKSRYNRKNILYSS